MSRTVRRMRALVILLGAAFGAVYALRPRQNAAVDPQRPVRPAITAAPSRPEPSETLPSVVMGPRGWLFYGQGVEHVIGPPFLDPGVLQGARSQTSSRFADPRTTIVNTFLQFRKRGIELILLPVPDKATVYAEELWPGDPNRKPGIQNASFEAWKNEMKAAGIRVFDPTELLLRAKQKGIATFSATDTHWTPRAIQLSAWGLASVIRAEHYLPPLPRPKYRLNTIQIHAPTDLVEMGGEALKKKKFVPAQLPMRSVRKANGRIMQPTINSDVLVLGDSCAGSYRVYGSDLASQLSFELGRPVDAVTKSNGGSWGARYRLRELMEKGEDHLAGKKLVIWEFVARDLSSGDWMPCDYTLVKKLAAAPQPD